MWKLNVHTLSSSLNSQLSGHSMYLEANFANGPDNGGGRGQKKKKEGGGGKTHQDTAAARRDISTGTDTAETRLPDGKI